MDDGKFDRSEFLSEIINIEEDDDYINPWHTAEDLNHMLYTSSSTHVHHYEKLFKEGVVDGKSVLVMRSGFGKVALLAKEYGAKKVVALDDRPVCDLFERVIEELQIDGIEVAQKSIKDIKMKFDVILCDWMGINIIYDSLIPEILFSKKLLKAGGSIYPQSAKCFICGIGEMNYVDEKYEFWKSVYGFDMTCMVSDVIQTAYVDVIEKDYVTTGRCELFEISTDSLKTFSSIKTPFKIVVQRKANLDGFCTYFEALLGKHKISTKPGSNTIWKQCCYFFPTPLTKLNCGDVIIGTFSMWKKPRSKRWSVEIYHECDQRGYRGTYEYEF
ncbi:Protein arginine N-methyltransferase [Entamoeba marina]